MTTEFLERPMPDFWGGISLVALGLILLVWATADIGAGYGIAGREDLPRWHPRRWVAPCFSWWLGLTLFGISTIFAYLGVAILTDDNDAPLWGVLLCIGTFFCALMAFHYWAIERLPEEGL